METAGIGINGFIKTNQNPLQKTQSPAEQTDFASVMQGYLHQVDNSVKKASDLSMQLAAGQVENIHEVTIASQQSKLALELTVTIRDKAVEAYQETMRMQI